MEIRTLRTATVKGHRVQWANNGTVYFGADLHDLLPEEFQGIHYTAKTVREFEAVCRILSARASAEIDDCTCEARPDCEHWERVVDPYGTHDFNHVIYEEKRR